VKKINTVATSDSRGHVWVTGIRLLPGEQDWSGVPPSNIHVTT